jgi:hypothetical protein
LWERKIATTLNIFLWIDIFHRDETQYLTQQQYQHVKGWVPIIRFDDCRNPKLHHSLNCQSQLLYTYWLGMRVITLLLPPRYQLFSEATPRKIVGTEGTIKVLLPEYQVYKCFIILNNCAIQNSKLGPFLMDF